MAPKAKAIPEVIVVPLHDSKPEHDRKQKSLRILVTGFTRRMVGLSTVKRDYATSVHYLPHALRELGHEVDHREVLVNEDLRRYDAALVGVCKVDSLSARFQEGAIHTLHAMSDRAGLFVDDWSCVEVGTALRSRIKNYAGHEKFFQHAWKTAPALPKDLTLWAFEALAHGGRWPLLAPMFRWGKHEKLLENNFRPRQLFAWDPTPFVVLDDATISTKQRRWVLATLQDQTPWVASRKLTWPVEEYGNQRKQHKYLPEREVLQLYAESWGVLAPRYLRAGSGWWRLRYQHAVHTGSVALCDFNDAWEMDDSYNLKASVVEKASEANLREIATAQAHWFRANTAARCETLEAVRNFLKTVAQGKLAQAVGW